MPVDTPSPEYEAALPRWQRCRDCFEGSDAVKARATAYLPTLEGHKGSSSEKYDAYKTRAVFYNATARTVAGLLGSVFRATPSWTFPALIEDDLEDVTLMGRPLVSFALMAFKELLVTGRVGVQVDMPKAPAAGAKTRPYWVLRRAEDILSWRTVVRGGQETLTRVVLSEVVEEDDPEDEWSPTVIDQIRVLELVQHPRTAAATYQIRRFRKKPSKETKDATDTWEAFEAPIVPLKHGDPLTFIPFQFIGPTSVTPAIEKSPMVDIVDVNLSHYRTSADFEHGAHVTALPTPWVSGVDPELVDTFPIGSATAWVLQYPQARAGMLEFTGDGLKTLERSLSVKQEQMASLGARLAPAAATTYLHACIRRVVIRPDRLTLEIDGAQALETLLANPERVPLKTPRRDHAPSGRPITLDIPAVLTRAGLSMRLVVPGARPDTHADPCLIRLLWRAFTIHDRLTQPPARTLPQIAAAEQVSASYVTRLLRLRYLAPDIVAAIVEGRQPAALTATTLMHDTRLPVAWAAQRAQLGFASPSGHDGEPRGHPGKASQPGVGGGDARA